MAKVSPSLVVRYKKEYDKLLIDLFSQGKGRVYFTSKIGISKNKFYYWLDTYPSFSEAYEVAKEKAHKYMVEQLPRYMIKSNAEDSEHIDLKVWHTYMRYSIDPNDARSRRIENFDPTASLKQQATAVLKALSKGQIDSKEAERYITILERAQSMTKLEEIEETLIKLEMQAETGVEEDEFKEESED